ncbi:hypothetical protein HG530_003694 [Fusarium avenaceum]|nr:hypothetical protein HG530_003694 [Fusarium avenaceum]
MQAFAGVGIPDANGFIITSRCNIPAIFGELGAGKALGVPRELADVFACFNVPQLHAEISRAGHDGVAPHLNRVDRSAMPAKLLDQIASLAIPDTDTKVLAACDDMLVVKGKIENSRSVVSKSTNGSISCTNVIDDAVLADHAGVDKSSSVKIRQYVDGKLGGEPRDKVDCADNTALVHLGFALHTRKSHCDSDTTLAVVGFVAVPSRLGITVGIGSDGSAGLGVLVYVFNDRRSTMDHSVDGERGAAKHALNLFGTGRVEMMVLLAFVDLVRIVCVVGVVNSEIVKMAG